MFFEKLKNYYHSSKLWLSGLCCCYKDETLPEKEPLLIRNYSTSLLDSFIGSSLDTLEPSVSSTDPEQEEITKIILALNEQKRSNQRSVSR